MVRSVSGSNFFFFFLFYLFPKIATKSRDTYGRLNWLHMYLDKFIYTSL